VKPIKHGVSSGAPEGIAVPALHDTHCVTVKQYIIIWHAICLRNQEFKKKILRASNGNAIIHGWNYYDLQIQSFTNRNGF